MRVLEVHGEGEAMRWAKFLAVAVLLQGVAALFLRGLPQQQFVKAAPLEVELVATVAQPVAPALEKTKGVQTAEPTAPVPVQAAVARPVPPVPVPAPTPVAAPAGAFLELQSRSHSVLQQETPKATGAAVHPAVVPSAGSGALGAERSASSQGGGNAAPPGGAPGAREVLTQARPNYLHNPHPPYPPLAKRRGLTGSVVLKVLVGKEGGAKEVAVRSSSGHAVLDQAALTTVAGWRFTPARRGEAPVESWVDVPIRFALNEREV